jgi:gamma-tubulin complex component 3
MKWLALLVDANQDYKGGILISSLYAYSKHGDPSTKALISRILDLVSQPIIDMIRQWMVEGELKD